MMKKKQKRIFALFHKQWKWGIDEQLNLGNSYRDYRIGFMTIRHFWR